jgi:hypothetical protein
MPRPIRVYVRGLGFTGWVMVLLSLALLVAILIAIAVVAAGAFLFLLPFMLISAVAFYFLPRRRAWRARYRGTKQPVILEGDFVVLDPENARESREDGRGKS